MIEDQLTYRQYAWKQFKKNKAGLVSFYVLCLLVFIAIFSPFLANDQPLFVKYQGKSFSPAFSTFNDNSAHDYVIKKNGDTLKFVFKEVDWRRLQLEEVWWPLIPYSPNQIDKYNRDYTHPNLKQRLKKADGELIEMPGRLRHFFGTDKLGRDVASGIVHGTRISLLVGLVSMSIALIVGLLLGATAGFYGDYEIKVTRLQFWMGWFGLFLGYFYGFYVRGNSLSAAFKEGALSGSISVLIGLVIWGLVIYGCGRLGKVLSIGSFFKTKVNLPIDSYVNRGIEVLNSLPILILIISISAIVSGGSLWLLMVIIGLTGWTGIARLIRAEMLRVKQLEYIQAGKALGFSNFRIILKHAVPNGLAPVFVTFAFGVASAILTESGLSFLGIGVPSDVVTWGSLLSLGRAEFEAWWLVFYPGLAIFITITVYNLIGEGLRDALDPKHKK